MFLGAFASKFRKWLKANAPQDDSGEDSEDVEEEDEEDVVSDEGSGEEEDEEEEVEDEEMAHLGLGDLGSDVEEPGDLREFVVPDTSTVRGSQQVDSPRDSLGSRGSTTSRQAAGILSGLSTPGTPTPLRVSPASAPRKLKRKGSGSLSASKGRKTKKPKKTAKLRPLQGTRTVQKHKDMHRLVTHLTDTQHMEMLDCAIFVKLT